MRGGQLGGKARSVLDALVRLPHPFPQIKVALLGRRESRAFGC